MAHIQTNACLCALRSKQPGQFRVRAVLRHFVPNKWLVLPAGSVGASKRFTL